ncbi:MAG: hypothetical protein VR74_02540 [Hyphomonas sp. BRH_c22]|nr:magnesium chelatase domain-containing protein [Hyphomonas sp. BRH_c22]KJS39305.1 MAG: hypothetical protein VR74_02540 [Hyphomonas sp. BRH_c22]
MGLGDKAVAESRKRVRAAFAALGLAMPPKHVIVNIAPADLPKEGRHYLLAIALTIMGVIPADLLEGHAALAAEATDLKLIWPAPCGAEAAWAGAASSQRRA